MTSTPADDPHWQRPAPDRRQQQWDVVVGVLLTAATLGSMLLGWSAGVVPREWRPGLAESVLWAVALGLPLVVRCRFPLGVMFACSAAYIGLVARHVPEGQLSSVCLFVAIFTAGAWGRERLLTRASRGVVTAVMFAWLAYALSATAWGARLLADDGRGDGPVPTVVATVIQVTAVNILYFGAAWFFGDLAWNQARQRALLQQRNEELAVERDRSARRAVIAERVRIARELHDVVAHHVSLMGLQTAAARRVLDRDPELTRSTLTEVESTGRSAMDEMHRLLGVLRQEDGQEPDRSPAPGLDDLAALVGSAGGSGVRTAFTEIGERETIPESLQVTVYRIAQEAITNTLRHAAATHVDVRLRHLGGTLELEVVDDGRAVAHPHRPQGSGDGMGHVGMRERTALHGGELELGPRSEGGYRVRARFPLAPAVGTA